MIKSILIFLFSLSTLYSTTIEGYAFDKRSNKPISGAFVILKGTNLGAASDLTGFFRITNLRSGKYTIQISCVGYFAQNDLVDIKDSSEVIKLEIILQPDTNGNIEVFDFPLYHVYQQLTDTLYSLGYLPSPGHPVIEDTVSLIDNYYKYFKSLRPENILSITLDSLAVSSSDHVLIIYSTFQNKSDSTVYICGCRKCGSLSEPVIYDSTGQTIKRNMGSYVSEGVLPDSFKYFTIEPHSSRKYTPIRLSLTAFNNYPSGIYYIKLRYIGKRESGNWGNSALNWLYKKPKYINYMALTGEYVSKDSLMFHYEKINK
ncbi:MAG: carboxypeptidase-like regulatory domain-containing protein [Ignavibacteriaceae bacterium]|nr:carboxypeptidase-like regulatory domain-containing protein [Ignavibacteriaceae bacterium]